MLDAQPAARRLVSEGERARLLLEVTSAIVSHLSLGDLLRAMSACLRQFFNHDFASMVLYDEETGQLRVHAPDGVIASTTNPARPLSHAEAERAHIEEVLRQTKGVVGGKGGAAELLGLPISTLRDRMKKHGLM